MATPSASSIINFVKKYPITLCGFSLLFMPSVHRLLLYFTPLLLSTAIFIVAMLTWGPSAMSSEKGKKRGKRNDWAFNGSLKIYEEEEEEDEDEEGEDQEEGEEVAEVSQRKTSGNILQQEEISVTGKASKKLESKLQEPDANFDEESNRVGTASSGVISRSHAEPDPDLGGDGVGTASNGAISGAQAESHPELGGDCLGTGSNGAPSCGQAEPDPDLLGDHLGSAPPHLWRDCVGTASYEAPAAEPDPDLHGEQRVEPAHDQDSCAAKHQLHGAPDHYHHLHDHAEPAPKNHDELAAGDHLVFHDAEPHDHLNYHDAAEINHADDYHDAEPNHVDDYHDAEPDPDLHGEDAAAHAKSEKALQARVENDDLHAAIADLRQKLGVMKRAPYTDDARDHMLSQQLAERLQTLQAAA